MYSSVFALPKEVLACLDETDAQVWMQIYNDSFKSVPEGLSEKEQVYYAQTSAWMGTRELPSAFSVEEWATVEDIDRDNEVVILDKVEEHIDKYIMFGGDMQDTHSNVPLGHVWHSERRLHPQTGKDGIVVWYNLRGGTYEADKGREAWLNGKNHLSIGASATVDGMECDGTRCYTKRGVRDLYEISLCDVPANPHADVIEAFPADNTAMAKSCGCQTPPILTDPLILNTLECKVFNGDDCILKKVAKVMHGIKTPHKLVMTDKLVKAYAEDKDEIALMEAMSDADLLFDYDLNDNGFIVKHKADTYHKYRVECDYLGYTDKFRLTKAMPQTMFNKLYGYDFIEKRSPSRATEDQLKMAIQRWLKEVTPGDKIDFIRAVKDFAFECYTRDGLLQFIRNHNLLDYLKQVLIEEDEFNADIWAEAVEEYANKSWYLKRPMEIEKKFHTEKLALNNYWLELWYGKKIEIREQNSDRVATIKGDAETLLNIWNNMNDNNVDSLFHENIDKSAGAMTGASAGAVNAVYGNIDFKSIQTFIRNKKRDNDAET